MEVEEGEGEGEGEKCLMAQKGKQNDKKLPMEDD